MTEGAKERATHWLDLGLIVLLSAAAMAGPCWYIADERLHAIRLSLVAALVYVFLSRHRARPKLYFLTLGFFLVYTIATIVVTIPNMAYDPFSGLFNFMMIWPLLYVLLSIALNRPSESMRTFYLVCMVYVPLMTLFATVEYLTGWHLPTSRHAVGKTGVATGMGYNENDFATMMLLALLFIHAYRRVLLSKPRVWVDVLYAVLAMLVFVRLTHCRTAALLEFLYVVFMFRKKYGKVLIQHKKILIVGLLFVGAIVLRAFLKDYRSTLYTGAFLSLFDSYGLGMGIWGDTKYYEAHNYWVTNVHSYLLQFLVTSGLVVFLMYLTLIIYLMRKMAKGGRNEFYILPVFYLMALNAPSSSLFIWGQYFIFVFIVVYAHMVSSSNEKPVAKS